MTGMYLATQRMERVKKPISHWFHGSCAPKRHWRVNSSLGRLQFITYTFRKTHTRASPSRSEVSSSVARKTLSNGQADWRRLLLIHWRNEDEFRPSQSHQSSWRSTATLLSSKAKHSHVQSTNKISVLCCCGIFCRRMSTFTAHIVGNHQSKQLEMTMMIMMMMISWWLSLYL